ncbi:hypothetical protein [Kitasatospora sp. NBC_01302]|uniref:hypothetical protein n=1 Tax=Kitasatospora sp. NBC_01302 TaxID=2903575 RepID=UPI002E164074|nr:hypothetical protein OG294_14075 [Kitasatospora sp. NBC_01302]
MTDQAVADGYTVAVYFPPEAPREVINAFVDRMVTDAHAIERDGWDASCVGLDGDVLGLDGPRRGRRP